MKIDARGDYLEDVRRVDSPNCDARPDAGDISLIVVHGISLPPGEYDGTCIDDLFTNCLDPDAHPYFREIAHLEVSSHLLIRREGELVQYVPFTKRAWHAGQSCYEGREACNDFSIGIELEGQDDEVYTDVQYRVLADVVQVLADHFPALDRERIVGHCDIAPGRKTDPGPAFDWEHLRKLLQESA